MSTGMTQADSSALQRPHLKPHTFSMKKYDVSFFSDGWLLALVIASPLATLSTPVLAQTAQEQRQDQLNRELEQKRLQRSQDAREQQLQNQNEQRLQQQQRQIEQRNQIRNDRDSRRARDAGEAERRRP